MGLVRCGVYLGHEAWGLGLGVLEGLGGLGPFPPPSKRALVRLSSMQTYPATRSSWRNIRWFGFLIVISEFG